MLTETQMKAVRITLRNDKRLHTQMVSYANGVSEGIYSIDNIHSVYAGDFGLCLNLSEIINACCPWANMSAFDIPLAVYTYIEELQKQVA